MNLRHLTTVGIGLNPPDSIDCFLMSLMRRAVALLGVAVIMALFGASAASAHVIASSGYSEITQDGSNVSYKLSLEYSILNRAIVLSPLAPDEMDDDQKEEALEAHAAEIAEYLEPRVIVSLDSEACSPTLQSTSISTRDLLSYADLLLVYSCPGSSGEFGLQYTVFGDAEAVADDHTNNAEYHLGGQSGQVLFDRSHHSYNIGKSTLWGSVSQYAVTGVEHILTGLDHVLFIIALMLGASSFRDLLKVTAMFTLAHSVTLISTFVGVIHVPATVVEPLIALSIAFVAIENLFGSTHRRLPVVFVFGLLHGLGFAGSLQITDEMSWSLAASLVSFNVGIEIGQAALVLVIFPLILLSRRTRFSTLVFRVVTSIVAACGLFWFVERFFLA
ncbi:HupE/UreJ family protein [Promicromonospora sp. NPDC090134]|uniref:HupE/UreJ family protein n=1 Tax=Promicromonospora sp. NPDC090134 TaxID=3364408 RepID=UPI00380DC5EC